MLINEAMNALGGCTRGYMKTFRSVFSYFSEPKTALEKKKKSLFKNNAGCELSSFKRSSLLPSHKAIFLDSLRFSLPLTLRLWATVIDFCVWCDVNFVFSVDNQFSQYQVLKSLYFYCFEIAPLL